MIGGRIISRGSVGPKKNTPGSKLCLRVAKQKADANPATAVVIVGAIGSGSAALLGYEGQGAF